MVRMNAVPPETAKRWSEMEMPEVPKGAWVTPKPLKDMRVAIISSAGLHLKKDRPFFRGEADYRTIPADVSRDDLYMSHVSSNFDRVGLQEDINVAFPVDRLRELADEGFIGSVATNHFSFMGATDPTQMKEKVGEVADKLRADKVDTLVLAGV